MKCAVFILSIVTCPVCFGDTSFADKIPDFTQTDVTGIGSGDGQQYCAPVAISNSIVWLNKNDSQQLELVNKLASKQYMNTSLKNGTGTTGVLRGVEKISTELFGGYKKLEYEGWRKHPKSYSSGVKVPNIKKVKSFISKNTAAWINVGWYKFNKGKNEYERIGGHWITLVGTKGNEFIFHDPAPRAGKSFSNEYVEYTTIKNGTLVGQKSGLPTSAKGYISLEKGMHVKSGADFAIVDGIVYFEI